MRNDQIEAQVKARNRLNKEIFNIVPAIFAAITPFFGQKIVLTNGGLTNKVTKALPVLPNTVALHAHYSTGHGYSLTVAIRTCENVYASSGCVYAETYIYIGDLKDRILVSIYEQPNPKDYPTQYTLGTVLDLEAEIRKTEAELSTYRSRLNAILQ